YHSLLLLYFVSILLVMVFVMHSTQRKG
ncbi:uncharacterized protein METZ01_LOCUS475842, partial [marine metagenome]